ncbi:MAG: 50S ribosomal protein L22 [Actinobacteria bacterium]|nr:50S ribosomal protein L22 [Actinomycetota bacterium]
MSFGTKTNERPGTRAQARYIRMSPSKAREVLDLIRGRSVAEARDILDLVERGAAEVIAKVLNSAVANAVANDDQEPERLFVSACYADEGPTLKRFRARARGRSSTIRKRTCHITVIVSRMSDDDFARLEAKAPAASGGGRQRRVSASRANRVAKSRQKDAGKAGLDEEATGSADAPVDETPTDETPAEDVETEAGVAEDVETEGGVADDAVAEEATTDDEVAEDEAEDKD